MTQNTAISWTHHTYNPWWGCLEYSEGCTNCYARIMAERFGLKIWGVTAPRRFFADKHWAEPMKWNKWAQAGICYACAGKTWITAGIPCETCGGLGIVAPYRARVFCASMADVLERHAVPETQEKLNLARARLSTLISATPWLDWLILTKRIENAEALDVMFGDGAWAGKTPLPKNVWLGCTAENQKRWDRRIPVLAGIDAAVRFVSVEPQVGPITMFSSATATALSGEIDWIICGGESGPHCRPFDPDWARQLRDDCAESGAAFWMKQLGGHPNKQHNLSDLPQDLRIQELPQVKP